ncbi:hypothetical protein PM082_016728 [Marasmius tenuissimus]|nr:hypothetical protein PM082_016728 [Marasmius tenuissimus]
MSNTPVLVASLTRPWFQALLSKSSVTGGGGIIVVAILSRPSIVAQTVDLHLRQRICWEMFTTLLCTLSGRRPFSIAFYLLARSPWDLENGMHSDGMGGGTSVEITSSRGALLKGPGRIEFTNGKPEGPLSRHSPPIHGEHCPQPRSQKSKGVN